MTRVRRESPYVGLVPYSEADHHLFFGREKDTERVTANLFGPRLTLLYGQSGVGKSSLLNAGVLYLVNQGGSSVGAIFRDWSQADPLVRIASEVESRVANYMTTSQVPLMEIAPSSIDQDGSAAGDGDPVDRIRAASEQVPAQIMILLDQFEDYFLYVPEEDEGTERQLARALTSGPANVSYLLAIREDSLALLDRFKGLVPGLFDNYLRIDPLDRAAAMDAIVKPLAVFRDSNGDTYDIEDALVSSILDDLQDEAAWRPDRPRRRRESGPQFEAALLQVVMDRLWEEETSSGSRSLRASTYARLKGSRAIIRSYLDRVMTRLGPDGKRLAYRVFGELVTGSGDKIAHRIEHLSQRAFVDPNDIRGLLQQLVNERILRVVDVETQTYEVYHDVLARAIQKWREDYERETDPSAPARRSLQRRLAHAIELAKQDSREQQLRAISSLTKLGRSRVDPEIPEQAVAVLRNMAKSRPRLKDLGQGSQVQAAATAALSELDVDILVHTIQESFEGITDSASEASLGDFEEDQIRSGVETIDSGVGRLIGLMRDQDPSVKQSASDAVYDIYLSELIESLDGLGERFSTYADRLRAVEAKCDMAIESYGTFDIQSEDSDISMTTNDLWDEPAYELERSPTYRWAATATSALLSAVLGVLGYLGLQWLLDGWLGEKGWVQPSGSVWVLTAIGALFVLGIAAAAHEESVASGILEVIGLASYVAALFFLVLGVFWFLGNLLGVMALATFGFSLTWSTYASIAGLVLLTGGVIALVRWVAVW